MDRRAMTLAFDPVEHRYSVGRRQVPGVTSVLSPYNGFEHVDPEVLRVAAEFGRHVHDAIDLYNRDELDHESLNPSVAAYLDGWVRFLAESGFVVVESEARVYHQTLGYAGALDVVGNFPTHKELSLIDTKTTATVPKTVGPQTAAYSEAWAVSRKARRLRRYCCHLAPNKYTLVPLTDVRDFDIFKAALTLHKWRSGE